MHGARVGEGNRWRPESNGSEYLSVYAAQVHLYVWARHCLYSIMISETHLYYVI